MLPMRPKSARVVTTQPDASTEHLQPSSTFSNSNFSKRASIQALTVPDGGREAWTVVAGAWLAVFVACGFVNAFGVFQAYYKAHQLAHKSEGDIAWIGAVQTFLMFFMGSVFGSIFDKFGARLLMITGGLGFSLSCMMQSICKEYWQFFLAQGLLQGLSLSCLFSPSYSSINHWFFHRRALALGVASSGSCVGGVVWPIMINYLINKVGFGWALRTCGFISLIMTAVAAAVVRGRLPPRKGTEFFAFPLFKLLPYTLFCIGMFFNVFGCLFLNFFLPSYGAAYGFSPSMVFYSVSILNATSFFGRILPGIAADAWGRYNIVIISGVFSGIITLSSIVAKDPLSIILVGAVYGFTSGCLISLHVACIPPLIDDPRKFGVAIGQMTSIFALSALLGPPLCGWLITAYGFQSAQIFSGTMMLVGSGFLTATRMCLAKTAGKSIL